MKKESAELFHALMRKGWITREDNPAIWHSYEDTDVREDMETLGESLGFELVRGSDRLYLVPTQDNDLFVKTNKDYRDDISASNDIRLRDIYLMSYLAVFLIYTFYHGEGADPKCRNFISKEDFIAEFTRHCKACTENVDADDEAQKNDYGADFVQLANAWLQKLEGDDESKRSAEKYGTLNRLLIKFDAKHDDLFLVDDGNIRPTKKLDDLIPYFLRKERVNEIHSWIRGVS